jgi:RES domain-containing protein
MIIAYRLTKTRYVDSALSGEGARIAGGRWNHPGVRIVYAAQSVALATLEIMVHLEDYALMIHSYSVVPLRFPAEIVEPLSPKELYPGWDHPTAGEASKRVGDAWARSGRSAVLAVPSVVVRGETNFLLNPAHPEFGRVEAQAPAGLRVDPRLVR